MIWIAIGLGLFGWWGVKWKPKGRRWTITQRSGDVWVSTPCDDSGLGPINNAIGWVSLVLAVAAFVVAMTG
jgi:hypothetical protein